MGEQNDQSPKRLSISEEVLKLQLSEMELRLRIFFSEQLGKKADDVDVRMLAAKVDALDRGDFTPVHARALSEFIKKEAASATAGAWTKRERLVMVIGVVLTLLMFSLNLYVVTHQHVAPAPKVSG